VTRQVPSLDVRTIVRVVFRRAPPTGRVHGAAAGRDLPFVTQTMEQAGSTSEKCQKMRRPIGGHTSSDATKAKGFTAGRLQRRTLRVWKQDHQHYNYLCPNLELAARTALERLGSDCPKVVNIGCGQKPCRDLFPRRSALVNGSWNCRHLAGLCRRCVVPFDQRSICEHRICNPSYRALD
jgi:hypothetical protein